MSGDGEPKLITGDASKYIKLNVGENLFRTTIGTLTKYDTMLQAMFSGEIGVQTDSEGKLVWDASLPANMPTSGQYQCEARQTNPPVAVSYLH